MCLDEASFDRTCCWIPCWCRYITIEVINRNFVLRVLLIGGRWCCWAVSRRLKCMLLEMDQFILTHVGKVLMKACFLKTAYIVRKTCLWISMRGLRCIVNNRRPCVKPCVQPSCNGACFLGCVMLHSALLDYVILAQVT